MTTIGYATLPIIPSMQGISQDLSRMIMTPMQQTGRQAGQAAGRGVAEGVRSQASSVEAASEALQTARDKEADAAGRVRVAEAALEDLRARGITDGPRFIRAEEALEAARRRSQQTANRTRAAERDLAAATRDSAEASDEAAGAGESFGGTLDGMRGRATDAAKQMAGLAAATAGVGGAMATAAAAIENEALGDKLTAQLGAGPEMAAEFGGIAGRLYADAYGENLAGVNEALRNVWQQGLVSEDATTAEIEGITAKVLDLATAFDQDVFSAANAVGTMLKTGLAPDAQAAMDVLTRGFQQGADKGQDLLDTFTEYSVQFQAMGLDAADSVGLMTQALGGGARNADLVVDALKEFTLQVQGGSEATRNAISDLGFSDVDAVLNRFAQGGDEAQAVFTELQSGLVGMEDPAKRAEIALGLYGTKFEDLQAAIYSMDPSTATQALGNIDGAATKLGDTLNDNTANSLEKLKRGIQGDLIGALTGAAGWIERNQGAAQAMAIALGVLVGGLVTARVAAMGYAVAQGVMAAAQGAGSLALAGNTLALGAYAVATGVVRGATMAWSAVQWVLNAALSANPIGLVVLAIGALIAGIVLAWQNSETFRNIVLGAWDAIKTGALWLWDNGLKPFFSWWGDNFAKAGEIITGLATKAGEAKDWIIERLGALVSWVTEMPGRIRSAAAGLFDGISDAFKSAINWVIGHWNNFRLGFDFTIPVINKHVSFSIDTPDLPTLAAGGTIASRNAAGLLSGPGTGLSDSIFGVNAAGLPIVRVANGEGVVTEQAMANGGAELVAALNAGWVPSPELLHAMLPGYADGGVIGGKVTREDFLNQLRGIDGAAYVFGGWDGTWETDCSGAQAKAANLIAYGNTETGGRFGTANMADALKARGALPGLGGPDDYNLGWMNGGPGGGHTAGTLPGGIGFEMGGPGGIGQYGGTAQTATAPTFTDHMHFPSSMFIAATIASAPDPNAAATPPASTPAPSSTPSTSAPSSAEQKTRLKTFEELGADFGGIFAKGILETLGLENSILADPNKLFEGDDGSSVRTTDARPGQTGVPPASSTAGVGTGDPLLVGLLTSLGLGDTARRIGLFDNGGMLMPNQLALSLLDKPEPLLPADKWQVAEANIGATDRLIREMGSRGPARGGDTYIANGYTAGDIATEWQRRQWARTGGYGGRSW
ncbi:phage tail tape measure protein [Nocardia sp. CA-290969]|uniref:phage tail tape measure protein n=1 Tax=Nocardia sp. CA-290969 TaxID=3239986 RepID=UPI003D91F292